MTGRLPDDATLVALLDGELPEAEAQHVLAAARSDARLHDRLRLLQAARAELVWALGRPDAAPPDMPSATPRPPRGPLLFVLLGAAALAVVVVLGLDARQPARDAAAENRWLQVRLVPLQPAWELFSPIRFELEGTAKTATDCCVVARKPGESGAELAVRVAADAAGVASLPLVLEAEVTGPDGKSRRGSVARVEHTWTATPSRLVVELVDVLLPHAGINPMLNVALEPDGVREDFWWGIRRAGTVDAGGTHGFVPEEVGEYRIRFTLRSFAPAGGRLPAFDEPLEVSTGFAIRGVVGAWSEPLNGIRARIVANTDHPGKTPLVFAVQLRNESDRPRTFNVTGTTIAKIPQPFHFDLMIDAEAWFQRDDLGVITPAMSTGLALEVGGERSVVVLADFWRRDGQRPAQLSGRHAFAVRFHSEASLWLDTDKALWQGKIDTPAIAIEMPGPK
ncbi:MAG TPA: hypothetical protein VFD82_24340 [Planctomycetota bacterium]|nr:hypothetical protein [Planctomycetota bacterium]